MALIEKKINFILNLLNEDTCGSALTFEQISRVFHQQISSDDYLFIGNTFVLLLQNHDLISSPQQRLIIFYLLMNMFTNERFVFEINPFACVFLSILQTKNESSSTVQKYFHWKIPSITKFERRFICLLIQNTSKDLFRRTPNEILQMDLPFSDDRAEQFQENIKQRTQQLPVLVQCHLPAVITDPEINNYGFDVLPNGTTHRSEDHRQTVKDLISNNVMNQTIHPEYLRLVPPLHECSLDEFAWLSPLTDIDEKNSFFAWDSSMLISNSIHSEIRSLMSKAYQRAISPSEQQQILDMLHANPDLISRLHFSPSKFPLLVETNPTFSTAFFQLLPSNEHDDYFQSLINMNLSLHSIEVVNRLSTLMELPQEFLSSYLFNCMDTCDQTKEKSLQNRLVRLVSILIQSMIRNKVIEINQCLTQIQTFSARYRSIKEAQTLAHLLETLNN